MLQPARRLHSCKGARSPTRSHCRWSSPGPRCHSPASESASYSVRIPQPTPSTTPLIVCAVCAKGDTWRSVCVLCRVLWRVLWRRQLSTAHEAQSETRLNSRSGSAECAFWWAGQRLVGPTRLDSLIAWAHTPLERSPEDNTDTSGCRCTQVARSWLSPWSWPWRPACR